MAFAIIVIGCGFGTLVAFSIVLEFILAAIVALFITFPVMLSSSAFLAFAVDFIILLTFNTSVATSFIEIRLMNYTRVAFFVRPLVGSSAGAGMAEFVFQPFVWLIFWALVAFAIIVEGLGFRAFMTFIVVKVSLFFFAFVAGVFLMVVVRVVFGAFTFVLFSAPNFWFHTV